ncbi:MAG: DUF397 domain-containing protein [Carbonactinosporaceae bacterium]
MAVRDLAGAAWRTSSHSGSDGNCVETAFLTGTDVGRAAGVAVAAVALRDSKDRTGPALLVTRGGWRGVLAQAKQGAFDRP